MKIRLLVILQLLFVFAVNAQQLLLLDRFNGNKIVNDSTITVFSSDFNLFDLTQYFTMVNNTDKPLAVFLRKTVNYYADSTSDYYCFGIRCWPGDDSTNWADTIPPGGEDYTFASHVTHVRRFDIPQPLLPPGLSSITYTVYDKTTFPEPVEATVTVIYHLGGLGMEEEGKRGSGDAGNAIKVFPNPASEFINVKAKDMIPGDYTLFLYNTLGTLVLQTEVSLQDNLCKIPVSSFLPGFYSGRLVSEKSPSQSFRFQVSR
jgi:hypothetical protein